MTKYSEDELNRSIKQDLDESVDVLDANTLSKIRQIRAKAIEGVESRSSSWFFSKQGLFIGGLATACVMVFAVMILLESPRFMQTISVDDIEFISSSDNLDLFEDLEFYEWLEENDLPT